MIENPTNKIHAIDALYGRDSYILARGDGIVTWKDEHVTTAEETAAIDAKYLELVEEWENQVYARNRAAAYPSNGDQWDMIYKDNKNGTTTHAAAVEAVKTKWPKDNSGPVE